MIGARRDIDDLDNLFDRDEARHLREERQINREQAIEKEREESDREAARGARIAAENLLANRREVLDSYTRAGVTPPHLDKDGFPNCSLTMLLSLGWRVEEVEGTKVLLRPIGQGERK